MELVAASHKQWRREWRLDLMKEGLTLEEADDEKTDG